MVTIAEKDYLYSMAHAIIEKKPGEGWADMAQRFTEQRLDETEDVIAVFDSELNYLLANPAACKLLGRSARELEGNNLLHLFPALTASASHRDLLKALSGEVVHNAHSEGTFTRAGAIYRTSYYPVKSTDKIDAVLAVTKKVYYPEK